MKIAVAILENMIIIAAFTIVDKASLIKLIISFKIKGPIVPNGG